MFFNAALRTSRSDFSKLPARADFPFGFENVAAGSVGFAIRAGGDSSSAMSRARIGEVISQALRQLGALFALALVPALISGAIQLKWREASPPGEEVVLSMAESWGDKVLWVDARSRAKFERGHIAGAVLLNEDEWDRLAPAFFDAWMPDKIVVVYCDGGSCDASHDVARRLRNDFKIENVHVLKGGWDAWPRK